MHMVLIIDDDPAICDILTILLEMSGYTAVAAPNAHKGLDLLTVSQPSLIITDFNMPGMNGGELCRQLKRNPQTSHIPAILYSSNVHEAGFRDSIPADAFLAKPASFQSILAQVQELLRA